MQDSDCGGAKEVSGERTLSVGGHQDEEGSDLLRRAQDALYRLCNLHSERDPVGEVRWNEGGQPLSCLLEVVGVGPLEERPVCGAEKMGKVELVGHRRRHIESEAQRGDRALGEVDRDQNRHVLDAPGRELLLLG